MSGSWRGRLSDLGDTKNGTVEARAVELALPVRTIIPRIELRQANRNGAVLSWTGAGTHLGEALDDCLWEFVELEHATDEKIAAFANQYGLLSSLPGDDPPHAPEAATGWQLQPGTEPLAAWRSLATGVGALLDMATAVSDRERSGDASDPHGWEAALGALATIAWLAEPERGEDLPTSQDLYGAWLAIVELGGSGQHTGSADRLRWLLDGALRLSGVHVMPSTVGMSKPQVRYRLPTTGLGRLEQPSSTVASTRQSAHDLNSHVYWRVPSLLPVLATELARAIEPGEHYRCTRCGRLAWVVGRRPGGRREWFGDHVFCRRVHRADVVRRAAARRYDKVRVARVDERDERTNE